MASAYLRSAIQMRSMRVGYLLSDLFPYDKLICADAGPEVADEYGWSALSVNSEELRSCDIVIVDNRHHDIQELHQLREVLLGLDRVKVVLRVNDPYFFHENDPWYRFCDELIKESRAILLTPYQPTGLLSHWLSMSPSLRFVYAPFTYDESSELDISFVSRDSAIALSGNQRRDLYPLRYRLKLVSKLPWSGCFLSIKSLPHPGYPEKIAAAAHEIIREKYVQWLSRFRVAFVDSSLYRLEFLKYREIAYAGCAAIGDLPWSLAECPDNAFLVIGKSLDLVRVRSLLCDPEAACSAANRFRVFMRSYRSRRDWRSRVRHSLESVF